MNDDRNMNNELKIRVLMIYYDHWGKEEIRQTRDQKGFMMTMDKIKALFMDFDDEDNFDFLTEVRIMSEWIHYGPYATISFTNRIIDTLLSNMGGSASILSIPMPRNMESKLAKNLHLHILEVFKAELSDEEIRQTDAIVAW
jgi:hypothetical protein